ncbi:glycine-rich protein [Mesonia sp.]|uniref:glycine-rich protein n=1 Tax=Mesonia sp. TaxID=1960830 RepID=UPI0017514BD1|nr:glycine-rich protein [Mesonia sp.]HIB37678.1 HYR domain-containing protein [Mesonia sp.]HIO26853.1 HYR domain-containing protein [Flavobacteriaceae bacterium]
MKNNYSKRSSNAYYKKMYWLATIFILAFSYSNLKAQTTTFNYTGASQTYTVPGNATHIKIECWGAQGGTGIGFNSIEGTGGLGGYMSGDIIVTPGQVLEIFVGGAGAASGPGGFNGGGQAATDYGGAGGGASDVRIGTYTLMDRIIVAGGGGGGAFGSYGSPGGPGGGLVGDSGTDGPGFTAGGGGTQTAGGNAGCCYGASSPGTFGFGAGPGDYHNAGGGGGWYGGGSGAGHAGAGGGSSYASNDFTNTNTSTGINSGNGKVVITVLCDPLTLAPVDTSVCEGSTVTLNATSSNGGTITWDNGITNNTPFTISSTTTFTATSSHPNDCSQSVTITVTNPPTLNNTTTNVSCNGGNNGSIDLTVTGGTPPYSYAWDNSATTEDLSGLIAGTYNVTVTDTNGCITTESIDVFEPINLTISANITNSSCSGNNGSIDLTVIGGNPPYAYAWSNSATTQDLSGLESGTYNVTVTDIKGCTETFSTSILTVDNEAPIAICNDITVQLDSNDEVTILPEDINNGSYDQSIWLNYGDASTYYSVNSDDQGFGNGTGGTVGFVVSIKEPIYFTPANSLDDKVRIGDELHINYKGSNPTYLDRTIQWRGIGNAETDVTWESSNFRNIYSIEQSGKVSGDLLNPYLPYTIKSTFLVNGVEKYLSIINGDVTFTDDDSLKTFYTLDVASGQFNECSELTYAIDVSTFDCSMLGDNQVTLTVTDTSGNSDSCTATVTVLEDTNPTANCVAPFTVYLDENGNAQISESDINDGSSDNCGVDSVSIDVTEFDCTMLGDNQVTLTVTDASGNSSTCTTTVTVVDEIDPEITCIEDITVNNDLNECGAMVTYTTPTASDNCAGTGIETETFSYTGSVQTFTIPTGVTSITIEAWGAQGQSLTNEQYTPSTGGLGGYAMGNIAVTPGETINIYVGGEGQDGVAGFNGGALGGYGTPSDGLAGYAGSGGGASDVRIGGTDLTNRVIVAGGGGGGGRDYVNGTCQPCGQGGNGGAGGALIGENGEDPTDPIYNAYFNPGAGGLGGTQNDGGLGGDGVQGVNGNPGTLGLGGEGIDGEYSVASGGAGGGYYGGGSGAGANSGSGAAGGGGAGGSSYIGGVTAGTTTVGLQSGNGQITISYNSSVTATLTSGLPSGSIFPVGETINTYEVVDASGNVASCSFTITVEDNENPTANCIAPFTISLDSNGNAQISESDINDGSSDNCGVDSVSIDTTDFDCTMLGENQVTLTVTDASGNSSTCTTTVTIIDDTNPIANCVAPFTISLDANGNAQISESDVNDGSTDNCGVDSVSIDVTDFDCTMLGENQVTLTVTDASGNSSTCTTTVTIIDDTNPIANCVAPFTTSLDANGNAQISESDINDGSIDNCSVDSISIDTTDFDCTMLGENDVTLTVTDASGNSSTCTTTVTVIDDINPIANCVAPFTIALDGNGNAQISESDINDGSSDNCGVDSVSIDTTDFDCTMLGENDVTLTVTDASGNSSTCTTTVTIIDDTNPIANCVAPFTIALDGNGNAQISESDINDGSTDNCGVDSVSIDVTDFDCTMVGNNQVTLTVTDASGNSSICTTTVTVEDNEAPIAMCQDITVSLDDTGNVSITASDIDNGSTDNCAIDSYEIDVDSFDCTMVGMNMVTLTITDTNGNSSTCTSTVTVEDNELPSISCEAITVSLDETGNISILPEDLVTDTFDNCGIENLSLDIDTFDCEDIGNPVDVTIFAQDASGNMTSCTTTVTVIDDLDPEFMCLEDQTVMGNDDESFYVVPDFVANGEVSAIDNCDGEMLTISQNPPAGSLLEEGEYDFTFVTTDSNGNTSVCISTITVETDLSVQTPRLSINTLSIYPNPAETVIQIENPQHIQLKEMTVYDLNGRKVMNLNLESYLENNTIDISRLEAAQYFVMIKSQNNGVIVKRLIKE